MILVTALVITALTYAFLLTLSPSYTGTTQLLLDQHRNKVFGADQLLPEINLDNGITDSQISVIKSANLLRHVVEKQNLVDDPEFSSPPKPSFASRILALLPFYHPAPARPPAQDSKIPPEQFQAISALADALSVTRLNRTFVIVISVTSHDPDKAVRLANAVADTYVADQLEARYVAAREAAVWFSERLTALGEEVRTSEQKVADFRRAHNLLTTSSENKTTIGEQQLSDLNSKLVTLRAEVAEKRAKYDQALRMQTSGGNLQSLPDVVRSNVISELRRQQAETSRSEADLVARYGPGHPLVINVQAQRRDIERSIGGEVNRIVANLKADYEVSLAHERSLEESLGRTGKSAGMDDSVAVELRELERANTANKTLYETLLARSKINQEQSTLEEHEAHVISPAMETGPPTFPKKGIILSLSFVLGLFVGSAGALARDMLNAGFSTPREVEEKLGLPVLAAVPLMSSSELEVDGKTLELPRFLLRKPFSRFAEAIRTARVGVQMVDVDHPAKVILVTSSVPSEGKSMTAVSFAFSALMVGQKVLLIDGDLRHPSSTKFFGLERRAGLADLLSGQVAEEEAFYQTDGITVLPAGSMSMSLPDFGSNRMKHLLATMRERYDYIIVDSPPVAPVIDTRVLANLVDKVIFVVRWASTTREMVAGYIDELGGQQRLAGVVLNMVDESKTPRYGAYTHYSGLYNQKYYSG